MFENSQTRSNAFHRITINELRASITTVNFLIILNY